MAHRQTHQDKAKGHKDAESFIERAGYAKGGKVHMTNIIIKTDNPDKQRQAAMQGMKIGAAMGARHAASQMAGRPGGAPGGAPGGPGAAMPPGGGPRLPTAAPGQPPMGPPQLAAKGGKIEDTWATPIKVRAHVRRRGGSV